MAVKFFFAFQETVGVALRAQPMRFRGVLAVPVNRPIAAVEVLPRAIWILRIADFPVADRAAI